MPDEIQICERRTPIFMGYTRDSCLLGILVNLHEVWFSTEYILELTGKNSTCIYIPYH